MTLRANMELLKESFPKLWQKFSELEVTLDKNLVGLVTNKEGHTTLQIEKPISMIKRILSRKEQLLLNSLKILIIIQIFFFTGLDWATTSKPLWNITPINPFPSMNRFLRFFIISSVTQISNGSRSI